MPKPPEGIPSKAISVPVTGDALNALTHIVAESRRLNPEWQDTPQSVLVTIVDDFLEHPDAFDRFVTLRVHDEQQELLRQIAALKALKRTVRGGSLEEGAESPGKPPVAPIPAAKRVDAGTAPSPSLPPGPRPDTPTNNPGEPGPKPNPHIP